MFMKSPSSVGVVRQRLTQRYGKPVHKWLLR
jgi:hypothetical protein